MAPTTRAEQSFPRVDVNDNDDALAGARAMGVVIALLGSALLLLPPLLGKDSLREDLWAFDALRDVPLAVRLAGCALLWLSTWARVQQGLTRASGFAMEHGRAVATVLLCAGMALGWCARQRNFELGDSAHLLNFLTFEVHTRGQLVTYDEPLELFFHSLTYRILHDGFALNVPHPNPNNRRSRDDY